MKRFTSVLLLTAMTFALIFGGCGKTEKEASTNKEAKKQVDVEEWNPSTNWDYKIDNLHFSLPKYMNQDVDDGLWKLQKGDKGNSLAAISINPEDGFIYNETGETQDDRVTENEIKSFVESEQQLMIDNFNGDWEKDGDYTTTKFAGYKAAQFNLKTTDSKNHVYSTFIFNDWYGKTILLQYAYSTKSPKLYSKDYMSIIKNMTADEPYITENTKTVVDNYVATGKAFIDNCSNENAVAYDNAMRAEDDLGNKITTLPYPDQVYYYTKEQEVINYNINHNTNN